MNVAEQLKELGFGVQLQHDEVGEHYVELIVDGVKVIILCNLKCKQLVFYYFSTYFVITFIARS